MFSSTVMSVNGQCVSSSYDSAHGTNKVLSSKTVVNKAPAKIYFGDRFVNGKFMPAGYY
jgi:hypothetical protein